MSLRINVGPRGITRWFECELDLEPGRGNIVRYRVELPVGQEFVVETPKMCWQLVGFHFPVGVHSELIARQIIEEWDIVEEAWRQVNCPRNLADRLFNVAMKEAGIKPWRRMLAYLIARLVTWRKGAL